MFLLGTSHDENIEHTLFFPNINLHVTIFVLQAKFLQPNICHEMFLPAASVPFHISALPTPSPPPKDQFYYL